MNETKLCKWFMDDYHPEVCRFYEVEEAADAD